MKLYDAVFRPTEPTGAKDERISICMIMGQGSKQITVPHHPPPNVDFYEVKNTLFGPSLKRLTVEELKIKNYYLIGVFKNAAHDLFF